MGFLYFKVDLVIFFLSVVRLVLFLTILLVLHMQENF